MAKAIQLLRTEQLILLDDQFARAMQAAVHAVFPKLWDAHTVTRQVIEQDIRKFIRQPSVTMADRVDVAGNIVTSAIYAYCQVMNPTSFSEAR